MDIHRILDLAEESALKRSEKESYSMTEDLPNAKVAGQLYKMADQLIKLGVRLYREEIEKLTD